MSRATRPDERRQGECPHQSSRRAAAARTTGGYGFTPVSGARMPIPGNAEFAVFLVVWMIIAIIWAASDAVNAGAFVTATTVAHLRLPDQPRDRQGEQRPRAVDRAKTGHLPSSVEVELVPASPTSSLTDKSRARVAGPWRKRDGRRYARAGVFAGSNLSFARRRSSGIRVGYSPVRHARQSADSGRAVDSCSPSSERYASEVAPIDSRTSSTERRGGDQLVLVGEVDPVEARPDHGRRRDAHVHLGRAGVEEHRDDLPRRVAAHDRVVDDHDALARPPRRAG